MTQLRIGWFSSGRDLAARNLLKTVYDDITLNKTPAVISWVFCHRELDDAPASRESHHRARFFKLARRLDIQLAAFSHIRFMPELRMKGIHEHDTLGQACPALREWRNLYGRQVTRVIRTLPPVDVVIMAGYMLIVGEPELAALNMLNIHPALPYGPRGTWQEVVRELIERESDEQGVMIHLATSELDRGPVVSYCRFPIRGQAWDCSWETWKRAVKREHARANCEASPLFRKIRSEGEVRELPLLRSVVRELSVGNITIRDKQVLANKRPIVGGVDLTEIIEEIVANQRRNERSSGHRRVTHGERDSRLSQAVNF